MLRLTKSSIGISLVWICMFGTRTSAAETINACVNPAGQVRLVAQGSSCRPQEQLVIMNASPNALATTALLSADTAWVVDHSIPSVTAVPNQDTLYVRPIDAAGATGACTLGFFSTPVTLRGLKPVDISDFTAPFRIQ